MYIQFVRKGEARCVKRSDLINMLSEGLPQGTIHFGCHVQSVELDPLTNFPTLQLHDGSSVKAKVPFTFGLVLVRVIILRGKKG